VSSIVDVGTTVRVRLPIHPIDTVPVAAVPSVAVRQEAR
jgi:hypothetical protein